MCSVERQRTSMSSGNRASHSSATTISKKPKRQVTVVTFNKWKTQLEHDHKTLSWLRCDVDCDSKTHVAALWCQACRTHKRSITGMKNVCRAWISGTTNQKIAMLLTMLPVNSIALLCHVMLAEAAKASSLPITSYSPIARSLLV